MRTLILATAFAGIAASAFAQTNTPNIDARQANQEQRIEQGEASGSLNTKEANRLERQQGRTAAIESKAKSDGKVTACERARLQKRENKTSAHIAAQKHDAQTAK